MIIITVFERSTFFSTNKRYKKGSPSRTFSYKMAYEKELDLGAELNCIEHCRVPPQYSTLTIDQHEVLIECLHIIICI